MIIIMIIILIIYVGVEIGSGELLTYTSVSFITSLIIVAGPNLTSTDLHILSVMYSPCYMYEYIIYKCQLYKCLPKCVCIVGRKLYKD